MVGIGWVCIHTYREQSALGDGFKAKGGTGRQRWIIPQPWDKEIVKGFRTERMVTLLRLEKIMV